MEIIKFQANEVLFHIRHDLRELPAEKQYGNESIDSSLTPNNYSLIERGNSAAEINDYRKALEKEIFSYNRKNIVHAIEVVIQCPADCPDEQKADFFKESFNYICSTLPMGERCVFLAQVHTDEKHYSPSGKLISKDHLHIMYVPAVPDEKHSGYQYKLCADQLTRKAKLKALHPGLQKHLDEAGIHATVFSKKGSGQVIPLSVPQLKELTQKTGIVLDSSITIDELASIINTTTLQTEKLQLLHADLEEKNERIKHLTQYIETLNATHQISSAEHTWGSSSGWGSSGSGWGSTPPKTEDIDL